MTTISEIARDVCRISTFVPDFNLQFNQFVVRNRERVEGMFIAALK